MATKTFRVDEFRGECNRRLQLDTITTLEKRMVCSLLEHVLMETGNYHGFSWRLPTHVAREIEPDDPRYYDRCYHGIYRGG